MKNPCLVLRMLIGLSLAAPLLAQPSTTGDLGLGPAPATLYLNSYRSILDASSDGPDADWRRLSRYQDPARPIDGPRWNSAFTLGAMASSGNTRRRTANAAAEAERRDGRYRTTAKAAWNYAQTKATNSSSSGEYQLDQRHSQGKLQQDYFLTEKSFLFVGTEATNDYDRNLALRLTTTGGVGVQLIDRADTRYSIEIGAGYYREESRIANVPTDGYATGKIVSNFDMQFNDTWHMLHTITYLPSLDDSDELSGTSDTRLRAKMAEGLFAQLQWIVDYDNTPLADGAGNPNTRVDHRVFLSVGWSF